MRCNTTNLKEVEKLNYLFWFPSEVLFRVILHEQIVFVMGIYSSKINLKFTIEIIVSIATI